MGLCDDVELYDVGLSSVGIYSFSVSTMTVNRKLCQDLSTENNNRLTHMVIPLGETAYDNDGNGRGRCVYEPHWECAPVRRVLREGQVCRLLSLDRSLFTKFKSVYQEIRYSPFRQLLAFGPCSKNYD